MGTTTVRKTPSQYQLNLGQDPAKKKKEERQSCRCHIHHYAFHSRCFRNQTTPHYPHRVISLFLRLLCRSMLSLPCSFLVPVCPGFGLSLCFCFCFCFLFFCFSDPLPHPLLEPRWSTFPASLKLLSLIQPNHNLTRPSRFMTRSNWLFCYACILLSVLILVHAFDTPRNSHHRL